MLHHIFIFMFFFFCASVVFAIFLCTVSSCMLRRSHEGHDGEGREVTEAVGSGNMLGHSYGNPRVRYEPQYPNGYYGVYQQHHGRLYGHERPLMAVVAGQRPCDGMVLSGNQGSATSTGQEPVEYGEAVYLPRPDSDLTKKLSTAKMCEGRS